MKSSIFGMGTLGIGPSQRALSVEEGSRVILHALNAGIDLFDTAEYYDTYPYIRAALNIWREQGHPLPALSSRTLAADYEEAFKAVEDGLTALGADDFDCFMLHEVRGEEDLMGRQGAMKALLDAKEKGLIKRIGLSTHHTDVTMLAAAMDEIDVVFCLINKEGLGIRTGDEHGTKEAMEEAIVACHDAGKEVWVMKVFGGGNLVAEYRACLDYVRNLPGVTRIILGMATEEDVDTALAYEKKTLSPDYQPDTSQKRMFIEQTDCEGCGNCKNRCTSQAIFWNERGLAEIDQSKCVRCGYCAPVCPVRAIIYF